MPQRAAVQRFGDGANADEQSRLALRPMAREWLQRERGHLPRRIALAGRRVRSAMGNARRVSDPDA